MSIYNDVSKEIGWESRNVEIPSIEGAITLCSQARDRNLEAFKKLVEVNRFGRPHTPAEIEASNMIVRAYHELWGQWDNVPSRTWEKPDELGVVEHDPKAGGQDVK